jgi:toxin YoeB
MVSWRLIYTAQAKRDAKKLSASGLRAKAEKLLDIICINPFQNPPPYEKLLGDFAGVYSRRINIQHRLVYQVIEQDKIIKVIRMWSHYE